MIMQLQSDQVEFIEKISVFGSSAGLPRSTAKVLGFFLICVPQQQSAADVRQVLQLSLGSTSNALRALTALGVLQQVAKVGERTVLYELSPAGLIRAVRQKVASFEGAKDISKEGLRLQPDSQRLAAFYDIYAGISSELSALVDMLEDKYKNKEN